VKAIDRALNEAPGQRVESSIQGCYDLPNGEKNLGNIGHDDVCAGAVVIRDNCWILPAGRKSGGY